MEKRGRNLLEVHIAVFLFGLSGLFAKLVALPSTVLVFGRVFVATIALGILLLFQHKKIHLYSRKDYLIMALLGVLVALHWVCFFQSIQVSTVAIGVITYSTFPVFVAMFEPVFFREKFTLRALLLALITFIGVVLVIPSFDFGNNVTEGVLWGLGSGSSFALLSILNRRYVQKYDSIVIALYQDGVAAVVLLPFVLSIQPVLSIQDVLLIVLLGVVFTAMAHSLFIKGMTSIKANVASIIASLESFYGIVFAALLFSEIPTVRTILGGAIILGAAVWASLQHEKAA